MKRLHFNRPNNLSLLHDEILQAIPALRPTVNVSEELEPTIQVEGLEDDVWLSVPDDADEAAIAFVVQTHDPTILRPDPRADRLSRIAELQAIPKSTWTTAQLRELVDLIAQEIAWT